MSLTDKVLEALRNAILLESRVSTLAGSVGELAREVRDMDRRLVRLETMVELAERPRRARQSIEDGH
ncbi:MAG TPA: hypothetical protein VMF67_00095 [Rhizomicrobium sp.]|nr:hypothetical protein [Rhizomicrobium sp.]